MRTQGRGGEDHDGPEQYKLGLVAPSEILNFNGNTIKAELRSLSVSKADFVPNALAHYDQALGVQIPCRDCIHQIRTINNKPSNKPVHPGVGGAVFLSMRGDTGYSKYVNQAQRNKVYIHFQRPFSSQSGYATIELWGDAVQESTPALFLTRCRPLPPALHTLFTLSPALPPSNAR